ncbi:hypothetical protein [Mesobacillus harenae]|uniref:hypothetical protein n=1 Tax=Mesobacillus harenae TaxID=2213203 RepID=UPI0015811922|nr:hypothetical protein [Mesobacillus harenae]
MMRNSFSKLFWGFILVLIEIHLIVVDILPDPLGYLLIFWGVQSAATEDPAGKKAKTLALILMFVSLPTIFIQQNQTANEFGQLAPIDGWAFYMHAIGLLKLVLVFFVFKMMISIVKERGESDLVSRTSTTLLVYMIVMLCNSFLQTFTMNMGSNMLLGLIFIIVSSSMIMEIVFLVLLRRFMKIQDEPDNESHSIEI